MRLLVSLSSYFAPLSHGTALLFAKTCLDCYMERALLTLIEWHTRLSHVEGAEIWARGRFFEQWAPAWIQERFRTSFGAYDQADLERALGASMSFFRELGLEVARLRGYAYPSTRR